MAEPAAAQVSAPDRDALVRDAQQAAREAANAAEAAHLAAERAAKAAAALAAATTGQPAGPSIEAAAQSTMSRASTVLPTAQVGSSAELRNNLAASVVNGPNDRSLKSSVTPDFQLIASDKDKVASLAWTIDVTGRSPLGNLSADQLTMTASSKLNDQGEAHIVGLGGFSGGTEIRLTYIHYGSRIALSGLEKTPVIIAEENCLAQKPADPEKTCNAYVYLTGVGDFVAKYNKAGFSALMNEVLPGPMWFYGIDFLGNQTTHNYLDRTAFTLKDAKRFSFGASAFGGLIFGQGATAVEAGFTWRRKDGEQDPVEICQPIAGTIQSQCLTGPDGAPVRSAQAIASVSLRHAFPVDPGENWTLAIAPEISADFKNSSWSVDVPVYFAGSDSGKLRGGVRAIYLNERKAGGERQGGVTLALFVGVPFSLFHH